MIGGKELLAVTNGIMGEEISTEMQKWYEETIQSNARYVVYIVRRCYMLALIMEHITGIKMKDSKEREFLTDASFFLRCEELANYYRKYGQFPKILLCDDILIHGRNINHFLKSLEDELCELLTEYEKEEIQIELAAAIKIHVYVRSDKRLLLLGRYEFSLKYIRKEQAAFWRRVSSNISTLILRADMANACYVFSESIPEAVYYEIDSNKGWHKTVFQNTMESVFVSYGIDDSLLKAIYTIRLIKAQKSEDYRVVPFVFLPNLSEKETESVKNEIFVQLRNDTRWEKIESYINSLNQINGKRLFNEWLTLLMSQSFLNAFNKEYGISLELMEEEYIAERTKLLRNYNAYGKDITLEILDFTLTQNVLSIHDINKILIKNINEHFIMELDSSEAKDENIEKATIRDKMEKYFYQNAIIEETSAFELTQISYVPTKRRSMRRVRGCGFTLAALAELNGCCSKSEMNYLLAYFLQMIDAGVLAISSYASKETKVVGFAQFAKAGEQSLQIYPLRLYEYMPLLIKVYRRCILNRINFKEEIENFFSSKYCEIEQEKKKDIVEWITIIPSVGQSPYDWNANYLMKIDLDPEIDDKDKFARLLRYIKNQESHINSYEKYTEG